MADEYINQRLIQWADWAVKREDGAVGFPRECSYTRLAGRSGGAGFVSPDIDEDAMQVDKAVRELPDYLCATVRKVYIDAGTIEQKAKDLRCHRDTVYSRLDRARSLLGESLSLGGKKRS